MKKIAAFILVISISISYGQAGLKKLYAVDYTTFSTSEAGWYRFGGWITGGKRGAVRMAISLAGGNYAPQTIVIDAYKNWGGTLTFNVKGFLSSYFDNVRIVQDGDYFIEVYVDREVSGYVYLYNISGYTSGFTAFSGLLSLGSGSVIKESGAILSNSYYGDGLTVDGKIGINTATPDSELEVNGVIRSKEVVVTTTGIPDYVFEPDYDLRSLEEVATFIRKNKHLPGVPSAAEVQANGLQLAEMNKILLRKVEELTLYLLEQNEQIKALKNKIKKLEND